MNKHKIAFFISLKKIKEKLVNIDIEMGNPGIGGTQYTYLLTVKFINRLYEDKDAIIITDEKIEIFDDEIPMKNVKDIEEAIKYCEQNKIETLVINANIMDKIAPRLYDTKINLFCWAHNTLNWKNQCIAAKKDCVKKVICVSKSQYENMKDTPCFDKCVYINNLITTKFYNNVNITDYSKKNVVYIGSIMPQKGVHNLINIWKKVELVHPDAQLYIFGGASIWNNNVELGNLKIADKYYDRTIQKQLKKIKNKDNIHFMGAQPWKNINKMLENARVGIVNPSKYLRDETFCISAVELETCGIPVISRQRHDGLMTTIISGRNGYLEKKDKNIASRICELLSNEEIALKLGNEARNYTKNFIVEKEIQKWESFMDNNEKHDTNKKIKISKDAIFLFHDFLLKISYLITSGKIFYLIKKKIAIKVEGK